MSGKKLAFRFVLVLGGFIAMAFALLYLLNNGNPYENYWVDREVPEHFEQMGFEEEGFVYSIRVIPKHHVNNEYYQPQFIVLFKDEPTIEYRYGVKKWGKDVVQFCEKGVLEEPNVYLDETTEKTLHSEDECDTMN